MANDNEFSEQTTVHEVNAPLSFVMWLVILTVWGAVSFAAGWKAHSTYAPSGVRVEMVAGVPCVIVERSGVSCDWGMATMRKEK